MIKIKCSNCNNTYEELVEVEQAEDRLREIISENDEDRVKFQRAPNYCGYCIGIKFYVDEIEIINNLNRVNNIEIIIKELLKDEGVIEEEILNTLRKLNAEDLQKEDSQIKNIIKRYTEDSKEEE